MTYRSEVYIENVDGIGSASMKVCQDVQKNITTLSGVIYFWYVLMSYTILI